MSSKYVDQMSNIMVLGGLLREPSILDRPEKYAISDEDFVGKTQQMCFLAINNLFVSGLKRIEIVDIVNYLQKNYPAEYIKFEKDDGVELLKYQHKINLIIITIKGKNLVYCVHMIDLELMLMIFIILMRLI